MINTREIESLEIQAREKDLEDLEDYRRGRGVAPVIYKAGFAKPSEPGQPMVFVASEEAQDRLGDIISVGGWELDTFRQNPVFFWVHDHSRPPIGTVPRVWVERKQLLNTVKWDSEADPFAREIQGKYERRVLRAESVGFRALEFDGTKAGGIHFTRQELLEISAVPIPAHPAALTKFMAGGFVSLYPVPTSVLATLRGRMVELTGKAKLLGGEIGRKLTYQAETALRELDKGTPSGEREALRRVDLAASLLKAHKETELKAVLETLQSWKREVQAEPSYWEARMAYRSRVLADGEIV